MKLMLVTSSFPEIQLGGIASYGFGLTRKLAEQSFEVKIVCVDDPGDENCHADQVVTEKDHYEGFEIVRIRYNWRKISGRYDALYAKNPILTRKLAGIFTSFQPNVIHQLSSMNVGTSAIGAAHELGIPIIVTATDSWLICPNSALLHSNLSVCEGRKAGKDCLICFFGRTRAFHWMDKIPAEFQSKLLSRLRKNISLTTWNGSLNFWAAVEHRREWIPQALTHVDRVLVPSRFLRKRLLESGIIPDEKVLYFPHGIEPPKSVQYQSGTDRKGLQIGFTGRPILEKGILVLFRAIAQLPSSDVIFHIWGDFDDSIQKYFDHLVGDAPNVIRHPLYLPDELDEVLAQLDMVVIPSLYPENAPLVVLEAFARGKPVLGSNAGGLQELINDGINGFLFERGNSDDLAAKIRNLIQHPEQLQNICFPPIYTVDMEIKRLLDVYHQAYIKYKSKDH